jgi:hypothetical protein
VAFVPRGRLKYGRRVSRFIAISGAVRDALVSGGVDPRRIELVYSGVPSPSVTKVRDWRAECRWPRNPLCGIVGAMTAEKASRRSPRLASGFRSRPASDSVVLLGGQAAGAQSVGGLTAFRAGSWTRSTERWQDSIFCFIRRALKDWVLRSSMPWRCVSHQWPFVWAACLS